MRHRCRFWVQVSTHHFVISGTGALNPSLINLSGNFLSQAINYTNTINDSPGDKHKITSIPDSYSP